VPSDFYIADKELINSKSCQTQEIADKKIPIGRNFKSAVIKKLNNQGHFI